MLPSICIYLHLVDVVCPSDSAPDASLFTYHMSVSIHYFEIFQNHFTCGLGCFYSFLSGSYVLYSCMLSNECADGFVSTCFICVILGASKVYLVLSWLPL
jgi:hypothetical protein